MEVDRGHRAALTLVGAAPLAVWFLIGPLREGSGTDYTIRVPEVIRPLEISLGLLALSIALVAAAHLRPAEWLWRGGWWRVYGRLLTAGVAFAVGFRVVTAASVGANIGGGGILLFGPLPLLYLLERARHDAHRLRHPEGAVGWTPSMWEWLLVQLLPLAAAVVSSQLTDRR